MKDTNIELLEKVKWAAEDKKAENITVIDLPEDFAIADQFVICTGASSIQVKAIAERIIEIIKEKNRLPSHTEGLEQGNWVLLDYGDVIVHVFTPVLREFYNLERLWGR